MSNINFNSIADEIKDSIVNEIEIKGYVMAPIIAYLNQRGCNLNNLKFITIQ